MLNRPSNIQHSRKGKRSSRAFGFLRRQTRASFFPTSICFVALLPLLRSIEPLSFPLHPHISHLHRIRPYPDCSLSVPASNAPSPSKLPSFPSAAMPYDSSTLLRGKTCYVEHRDITSTEKSRVRPCKHPCSPSPLLLDLLPFSLSPDLCSFSLSSADRAGSLVCVYRWIENPNPGRAWSDDPSRSSERGHHHLFDNRLS
jgi:hypothetical protein